MNNIKKYLLAGFAATALTAGFVACDEDEAFEVYSPEWLQQRVDSIAAANADKNTVAELEGMMEDVYTIGNTDFTSGFWASFSKYYVIPNDTVWNAQFDLHINSGDNTYYKNFALIICNDVERGGTGYIEYGAFRFDHTGDSATYNSQWGDHLFFSFTEATGSALMSPEDNKDAKIQDLNGLVTLSVERRADCFNITLASDKARKTYRCPYALPNLNEDQTNENICCFLVPEGSYIEFRSTNIEPKGGCTSALDKQPVSLAITGGVPASIEYSEDLDLDEIMAGVTATVTFEEGVTKNVTAEDLTFTAIPDLNTEGTKTLIASYSSTFKGVGSKTSVVATAEFNVIVPITSIEVTALPTNLFYYPATACADKYYVDYSGIEVSGVDKSGKKTVLTSDLYTVSHKVTSEGVVLNVFLKEGVETSCTVTTTALTLDADKKFEAQKVGADDLSTGWWTAFTDVDLKVESGKVVTTTFTNKGGSANNWNNFVVILRNSKTGTDEGKEYAVVRADNYGWGAGYENGLAITSGGQPDWAAWLAEMDNATVTVEVANLGNGTATVHCKMVGSKGSVSYQWYVVKVDSDDLNFGFTVDGSQIIFE